MYNRLNNYLLKTFLSTLLPRIKMYTHLAMFCTIEYSFTCVFPDPPILIFLFMYCQRLEDQCIGTETIYSHCLNKNLKKKKCSGGNK